MGYRLQAHIDDMSRSEAVAVVQAILDLHGTNLVQEAIKAHEHSPKRNDESDVAMAT